MAVEFGTRAPSLGLSEITLGGAVTAGAIEAAVPAAAAGVGARAYITDDRSWWSVASIAGVLTWTDFASRAYRAKARQLVAAAMSTFEVIGAPAVAGQCVWVPGNYPITPTSVLLQALLSTMGAATGTLRLYNLTDAVYVDINGVGVTTLATTSATPVVLTSTTLVGATGFVVGTQKIYELRLYTSDALKPIFLGIAEFVVS